MILRALLPILSEILLIARFIFEIFCKAIALTLPQQAIAFFEVFCKAVATPVIDIAFGYYQYLSE